MRIQGKRAGIPRKASWKEKQKENAQRLKGPQPMRIESRAHRNDAALSIKGKENREGVAPASEEGGARVVPELKRPRSIFEGFRGGSGPNVDAIATTFVAPVSGTPRDLVHAGAVQRGIPTRGGCSGPCTSAGQINHQILYSSYKFKEGAPLKEYLRQINISFTRSASGTTSCLMRTTQP